MKRNERTIFIRIYNFFFVFLRMGLSSVLAKQNTETNITHSQIYVANWSNGLTSNIIYILSSPAFMLLLLL